MPSKNEIANAKVAHLARHGAEHGVVAESITVDIATVRRRKRELAHGLWAFRSAETLEVILNDEGTRVLAGDKVFLDLVAQRQPVRPIRSVAAYQTPG